MATRKPTYIDFESGEIRDLETGDTIDPAVATNVGGGGAFTDLSDVPASYAGGSLKVVRVNAGETALEFATVAGGGDMLGANNLSDVASAATSRTNLGINTTANQTDSTNKRFVTDAQQTIIGNTSGTNTGDNATNTQYSGLAASKQDTLVSGTNIKTINGSSVLGSGDLTVSGTPSEIFQTEIDFGSTPVQESSFTISHTGVDSSTKIIASLAYDTPTGKDLDELDMDDLAIKCGNPTTDAFTMYAKSIDGSYLAGTFKINYTIFNTPI